MQTSLLRRAFVSAAVSWAIVIMLAPLVASRSNPAPLTVATLYAVYLLGSGICHQLPERSFHLLGHQMPVCARCAGIYAGAAIAALASGIGPRVRSAREWRGLLGAAALPAAISLLYEWTTGRMPANGVRAATGLPLGAVVAWMVVSAASPRTRAENQVN